MAEAPPTSENEDLSKITGLKYQQYMENGYAKFLVLLGRTFSRQCDVDIILTGSSADGSKVDGSDVDVMFCLRSFTLDESCFEYNEKCPCYFRVPRDKINEKLVEYVTDDGGYLTTKSLKELPRDLFNIISLFHRYASFAKCLCSSKVGFVFSQINGYTRKKEMGTEVSQEKGQEHHVDLVPSFTISGCENYMQAWSCRKRQWPPSDVVESIVHGKFHAVAKVSPLNGDEEKDFCLSFTVAEKTLMTTMSDDQLLCMRILKLIRSQLHDLMKTEYPESFHTTSSDSQGTTNHSLQDVFTSYHFKMAMFWVSETTNLSCWSNTTECVNKVLSFFLDCLECKCLPLYFVPSMNLFCAFSETMIQMASEVIRRFITSNVILREIVADCLDKRPINLSTTGMERENEPMPITVADVIQTGYHVSQFITKFSKENIVESLSSCCHELRSWFQEFLYPLMIMKGERDRESDTNVNIGCGHAFEPQTSIRYENYRNFNSELANSGNQAPFQALANYMDNIFDIVKLLVDEEDPQLPDYWIKSFPYLLEEETNIELKKDENSKDRNIVTDGVTILTEVLTNKKRSEAENNHRKYNNDIHEMLRSLLGAVFNRCTNKPDIVGVADLGEKDLDLD